MAADGRRLRTAQAPQACVTCKTRKKKCNRLFPSCGYCTRKKLDCVYAGAPRTRHHGVSAVENPHVAPSWGARPPMDIVQSRMVISTKLFPDHSAANVQQGEVYLEVLGIIRETGQFVDDISARYFQGFHRHLPVISRARFYNNFVTLGSAPAPDFSVLLLTICLITHAPALGYQPREGTTPFVEQRSLYLTVKSILAQAQVSYSPSVPLIQAGLLLAVYEYTHGRPDDAFMTITGSARMAYAARIHTRDEPQMHMTYTAGYNTDTYHLLQAEEAANTWWGIVICERTFFSEVAFLDQPLITVFPGGDARLPIEPLVLDQLDILDPGSSIPSIPVSCLISPKVEGFGRTAQATCLLDQVLKGFETSDVDSRLLQLDMLDTNIQAFLTLVMPQCLGQSGVFCAAVNIAIRSLFTLHWHILGLRDQGVRANFKPLEEWRKSSKVALDTVARMVVDIADSLTPAFPTGTAATFSTDAMPPMYPYIARAALKHIGDRSTQREDVGWRRSAERTLQSSLDKYLQRWGVSDRSGSTRRVDEFTNLKSM